MRLWHYKLLKYLPKSQLVSQWRELNSIFKNKNRHILINYVYEYEKADLYKYTMLLLNEMKDRKIQIKNRGNFNKYFGDDIINIKHKASKIDKPFEYHHNNRYLKQCFYNLQEKYDRGQKDFSNIIFNNLYNFVFVELKKSGESL